VRRPGALPEFHGADRFHPSIFTDRPGARVWLGELGTVLSHLPSHLKVATVHFYPLKNCSLGAHPSKRTPHVNRGQQGHRRRWFTDFRGPRFDPFVIDEIAAPDIRFEYSLHAPLRGRDAVREFATKFRASFPDLAFGGTAELIADG
jgi:hypothetical protein